MGSTFDDFKAFPTHKKTRQSGRIEIYLFYGKSLIYFFDLKNIILPRTFVLKK